ncbi:hypothetical protein LINPERPRIM_LOCUS20026 [Linum perenne]
MNTLVYQRVRRTTPQCTRANLGQARLERNTVEENATSELMERIPRELVTNIAILALGPRPEYLMERWRTVVLRKGGRMACPIKHLDWVPGYQGINVFYIPIGFYGCLPREVYYVLHYLAKTCVVGMVLCRASLLAGIDQWEAEPTSISSFGKWLRQFLSLSEWGQHLRQRHHKEYIFCTFKSMEKLVVLDDGYILEQNHEMLIH